MKRNRILKIIVITLLIILLSIISFGGIFVEDKNTMKNLVADYQLSRELTGSRRVELNVDKTVNTVNYDADGNIIEDDKTIKTLEENKIKEILEDFIGKQNQIPPMYSAIKVKGKKLYEYAREGKKVDIKPREIEIYYMEFKKYQNNEITFEVECSKGTYIRTLCEDIAKKLGTIGCMKELQRVKVDTFSIENSVPLENLDDINLKEKIITIEKIFLDKLQINLNDRKLELFLNGVQLTYELEDGLYRIYNNNKFIGLGIIKNKLLKRDIVI